MHCSATDNADCQSSFVVIILSAIKSIRYQQHRNSEQETTEINKAVSALM